MPPCSNIAKLIDYNTPECDYSISMTAETGNRHDCKIDQQELKKMLNGSDDKWRGTCNKAVSYTLIIEPTAECDGDWYLHNFGFVVKNAKKVEVYIDDLELFSVRLPHFTVAVFSLCTVLACVSVDPPFYIVVFMSLLVQVHRTVRQMRHVTSAYLPSVFRARLKTQYFS